MSEPSLRQKKYPPFVALCGRKFRDTDPAYFPSVQYRGRTLYLCTESCRGAFLADPDLFYRVHRNSEKESDPMAYVWEPGDIVAWRGIYRNRVWHVQPTRLVKDSPQELVLTLLPGTECVADEGYPKGKKNGKRRWHFTDQDWQLAKYTWRTNRLLLLHEPETYFSTILFWNHQSNAFLCYYINFQLPFRRVPIGIDTLDLELDLVIDPDFTYRWKDEDDYQAAVAHGIILPEWREGIEAAQEGIFDRLEKRRYPFDGSWLDWMPEPDWSPPTLPENWDKIWI